MHIVGEKGWVVGLLREDPPPYDSAARTGAEIGEGDTSYSEYDRAITDAAVDWLLHRKKAETFAGFISLVSPHYPLKAPEAFSTSMIRRRCPCPPTASPTMKRSWPWPISLIISAILTKKRCGWPSPPITVGQFHG